MEMNMNIQGLEALDNQDRECVGNALEELKRTYKIMNALRLKIQDRKGQEYLLSNESDMIKAGIAYEVSAMKDPETGKAVYTNQQSRDGAVVKKLKENPRYQEMQVELAEAIKDKETAFIELEHAKDTSRYLRLTIETGIGISATE